MNRLSIFLLLLSLIFIYACPLTESSGDKDTVVEEERYEVDEYEYGEMEEDTRHIENPGDIAGSLIF